MELNYQIFLVKINLNSFFLFWYFFFNLIASVDTMHDIEVEYVTFPGWRGRSTSECRTFNSLPHNARLYVQFIEQYLGVPGLFFFIWFSYLFFFFYSEMDWRWKGSYGNGPCLLKISNFFLRFLNTTNKMNINKKFFWLIISYFYLFFLKFVNLSLHIDKKKTVYLDIILSHDLRWFVFLS
jgi:hypothetical protein